MHTHTHTWCRGILSSDAVRTQRGAWGARMRRAPMSAGWKHSHTVPHQCKIKTTSNQCHALHSCSMDVSYVWMNVCMYTHTHTMIYEVFTWGKNTKRSITHYSHVLWNICDNQALITMYYNTRTHTLTIHTHLHRYINMHMGAHTHTHLMSGNTFQRCSPYTKRRLRCAHEEGTHVSRVKALAYSTPSVQDQNHIKPMPRSAFM